MFLKGVNLTVYTEGKKESVSEYLEADDRTLEVTASIDKNTTLEYVCLEVLVFMYICMIK